MHLGDDGDNTNTSPTPLPPTVTPQPILLPDPTFSLSLPPLDPTPVVSSPADLIYYSSTPSVVTTTVYVYPTQCSQSGPLSPVPGPSGDSDDDDDDVDNNNDTGDDHSSGGELSSISLPDVQPTPLVLPPS